MFFEHKTDSIGNQAYYREYIQQLTNTYTNQLQNITAKNLIHMDEKWRSNILIGWSVDWKNVDISKAALSHLTEEEYLTVLKLGTFHGNGYYRQKCTELLKFYEGSLPYLMLRLNDWVEPIRESAYWGVMERLESCSVRELFEALPMFFKVLHSGRRNQAHISAVEEMIHSVMASKVAVMPMEEIHTYDVNVKNAIYRLLYKKMLLDLEGMERLLVLERTGYGKGLLIQAILSHYQLDAPKVEQYLQAKNPIIRYYALMYRFEKEQGIWPGMEELLMDKSKRIRSNVSFWLEKYADMDVLEYYKKHLQSDPVDRALLGIGEHGSRKDAALVASYLQAPQEHLAAVALQSYGKLMQRDGQEVYWQFLFDSRQVLCTRAYKIIRKYGVLFGASALYNEYLTAEGTQVKYYLLCLLLQEASWERLPYLLDLYGNKEIPLNLQLAIEKAVATRAAYAKVSVFQAEQIKEVLARKGEVIPEQLQKSILFDLKYVTAI